MKTSLRHPLVSLLSIVPLGAAVWSSPVRAQAPDTAALASIDGYAVGSALPPAPEGTVLRDLTLAEALELASSVNLDLQGAQLGELLQELGVQQAQGLFTPQLSTTFGYNNATQQTTSQLDGGSTITNKRATLNTSLAKQLSWGGGRAAVNFNNTRLETDNIFATRNPSYTSTVNLSYTQPLLAGLTLDNQRAQVRTAEIQAGIVGLQIEARAFNLMAQVQSLYWGLKTAIEQIEIQRRNVEQARQLLAENEVREQVGRATRFQVIQSEAQLAGAEQALLNAEIQWRNQELALKQLLLDGASDPLLGQTINPIDTPELLNEEIDLDAAIERALGQRTDLQQQREQQRISKIDVDLARTNSLPNLDLTAGYSLQGVGGDLFQRDALGGAPLLISSGGWSDGLQSIADFDTPTWSLTLNASVPVGRNPNAAALERARLQLRQQDLALRAQELGVVTQVTSAGLAVRNTYLQYEAAQRNAEASELNLEAELTRFGVGAATNFEVVTAQNQLTQARLSVLQALINHLNAITEFERVQRAGN